ncbi:HrcA family transcriptional regulator [Dehalobacter sp. DCA]|uniref:HrcA family transcriptional regulator n=1 Tax=Dehalobacter sp. DCA TaxID=1147129 RepID=UPI001FA7D3C1|nr:HrcA family transcriptional regulator [Dehalobacter sp. DCA]
MFDDKDGESEERVYLGGTLNMLDQPEFRDINKVRSLFSVFEENNKLKELLSHDQKGLSIMIGAENADQVFKNCSIISATYQINGKQFGSVGVLGPTRMDYGKAIAIVDYMNKQLDRIADREAPEDPDLDQEGRQLREQRKNKSSVCKRSGR